MSRSTLNTTINTLLADHSDITATELRQVHMDQADYGDQQDALKVDKVTGKSLLLDTEIARLAAITGSNTGDETATTIKTKLSITTLSGSNTGDQDISGIAANASAIGTLSSLNTSTKANIVAALNEVKAVADTAAGGGTVVGDGTVTNLKLASDVKVGSLASLNTTAKGSAVAAINEVKVTADAKTANITDAASASLMDSKDATVLTSAATAAASANKAASTITGTKTAAFISDFNTAVYALVPATVDETFQPITYQASKTVAYDPLRPNKSIDLTGQGNIAITNTGTDASSSGEYQIKQDTTPRTVTINSTAITINPASGSKTLIQWWYDGTDYGFSTNYATPPTIADGSIADTKLTTALNDTIKLRSTYFDPKSITGLLIWLDATDTKTLTLDTSARLGQINDKSGNSNNLTQGTTGNKPTFKVSGGPNDLPYVSFTPGKTISIDPLVQTQPYTFYFVIRQNTLVSEAQPFTFSGFANGVMQLSLTKSGHLYRTLCQAGGAAAEDQSDAGSYINDFAVFRACYNDVPTAGKSSIDYNDILYSSGANGINGANIGTSSISKLIIGDGSVNFDFCEALIYNGVIDGYNDKLIKQYLMQKYNRTKGRYILFLGDSITYGQNATESSRNFVALTAFAKGVKGINYGVPGRDVTGAYTPEDLWVTVNYAKQANQGWAVLSYGTNSSANVVTGWKASYKGLINKLITYGYSKSKIVLLTPPYSSATVALQTAVVAYTSEIASELGVVFADYWTWSQANGGDTLLSDTAHPNDAGHAAMGAFLTPFLV